MAAYGCRQRPMAGWGQLLREYFTRKVEVRNYAMCGRSSRTFIEEGRLARIEREIAPGDYLLIQFGHNDATMEKPEQYVKPYDEFAGFLRQYIRTARDRQATPVLVTPMQRHLHGHIGFARIAHDRHPDTVKPEVRKCERAGLHLGPRRGAFRVHLTVERQSVMQMELRAKHSAKIVNAKHFCVYTGLLRTRPSTPRSDNSDTTPCFFQY